VSTPPARIGRSILLITRIAAAWLPGLVSTYGSAAADFAASTSSYYAVTISKRAPPRRRNRCGGRVNDIDLDSAGVRSRARDDRRRTYSWPRMLPPLDAPVRWNPSPARRAFVGAEGALGSAWLTRVVLHVNVGDDGDIANSSCSKRPFQLRKTLGKPPSISETEGVGTGITSLQYEARKMCFALQQYLSFQTFLFFPARLEYQPDPFFKRAHPPSTSLRRLGERTTPHPARLAPINMLQDWHLRQIATFMDRFRSLSACRGKVGSNQQHSG